MAINIYKIKKWSRMITGRSQLHVNQGIGRIYAVNRISGYYNDLTEKITKFNNPFQGKIPQYPDEKGILQEFSIGIFQYGLAAYDLYLLNNDKDMLATMLACANWAVDNQEDKGSWLTFTREFPTAPYSAMAQGEGISLLCRAFLVTKDQRFLEAIIKAKDFMLIPINKGGVTEYKGDEVIFYEFTVKPIVLNGWIFAMWGIWDYCLMFPHDVQTKQILEKTLDTIVSYLPVYDLGYWSKYTKGHAIASPFYHHLHIAQLRALGHLTGRHIFVEYAEKWSSYEKNTFNKMRAFCIKAYQKLAE